MTDDEFAELVAAGEWPGVEFKNARARTDPNFVEVVGAVLGMANRRDGGTVVLGIEDNGDVTGVSAVQAATWKSADHTRQSLRPYADPYVYVDVEVVTVATGKLTGRVFVVIRVREFDEVPVLCAQASPRCERQSGSRTGRMLRADKSSN